MIKALLFDLSRTILFPKEKNYKGDLNPLHKKLLSRYPNYNFLDYFELNEDLLQMLTWPSMKKLYKMYIFTSGSIQNAPQIKLRLDKIFKKIYSAEEIGLSKKDPNAYAYIVKDLNKKPSEILFIDDSEENLEAARKAGLRVWKYTENLDFSVDKINDKHVIRKLIKD